MNIGFESLRSVGSEWKPIPEDPNLRARLLNLKGDIVVATYHAARHFWVFRAAKEYAGRSWSRPQIYEFDYDNLDQIDQLHTAFQVMES